MKILISIGHPAHVHYFKNIAKTLQDKGNKVLFFVRNRECIIELVKNLNFEYVCYGKGGTSMLSKLIQIPIIDFKLLKVALKFKPDIFLSSTSPYAALVSKILKKPHIALDDTDHAKLVHMLYRPFTDIILSPYTYNVKLHNRQFLYNSFTELLYLHKEYFKPDKNVLKLLGVNENDKFCILRFISWNASHDVGINGLSRENKIYLVNILSEKSKVFISSEGELPAELEKYRLTIPSYKLHDAISYSSLCVSEGSTTASEAALLGVPTIYINPLRVSYCDEEAKHQLLYQTTEFNNVINKIDEIFEIPNVKETFQSRKDKLAAQMINGTDFIIWLIENYPESKKTITNNKNYQLKFK
ncbi:MAG: DUF354 domain-containing protein [Rikenellaceae bacterium]